MEYAHCLVLTDAYDPAAADDDRHPPLRWAAGAVDHCCVGERDTGVGGWPLRERR
jgi:hypothetical protein